MLLCGVVSGRDDDGGKSSSSSRRTHHRKRTIWKMTATLNVEQKKKLMRNKTEQCEREHTGFLPESRLRISLSKFSFFLTFFFEPLTYDLHRDSLGVFLFSLERAFCFLRNLILAVNKLLLRVEQKCITASSVRPDL